MDCIYKNIIRYAKLAISIFCVFIIIDNSQMTSRPLVSRGDLSSSLYPVLQPVE